MKKLIQPVTRIICNPVFKENQYGFPLETTCYPE